MKLVIVESPTKAKTIGKFLGKEYKVLSSFGHVRDLPKTKMGIDIKNDYAPQYEIPTKAKKKVAELQEYLKKSDGVILATDEDREGEAIAWHLLTALKLNKKEIAGAKRIVFHEITEKAIKQALENPRDIDLNLVDAQQARRILDRLVGYELSPFIWKKVRYGLSAGRVQSVALRFIAEREREIEKFTEEEYYLINTKCKGKNAKDNNVFAASLNEINAKKIDETITLNLFAGDYKTRKTSIISEKAAQGIASDLKGATHTVAKIEKKEISRTPSAPFTTSTLQQAAINSLGFSGKMTMSLAQKLYEVGLITYMRTDSVNLSLESLLAAKKLIEKKFGPQYALASPRYFKNRSKNAQEAHEAIRPTDPGKTPETLESSLEPGQIKLYKLIWKRMIASQMQPAVFDSVKVDIASQGQKDSYLLRASGSTVKFDGYLQVYNTLPREENLLPPMEVGDQLDLTEVLPEKKSTTPPPRYNEASLVKVLEEYGIGRPSTYAPTISTIMERKYIEKQEDKKLHPQEIGLLVNDILVEHFPQIVDIRFTAHMEEAFDEIAAGKMKWVPVIKEFYEPFHQNLEIKTKEVKKEDVLEKLDRQCPNCGGDLIVKHGRFGKFIACLKYPTCKYTEKTAEEKKVDDENSGEICDKCGAPMVVKRGRFGVFLGCSKYPDCKGIKKIENKTGVKCPACGQGEIVERKSKKGKTFFGCNNYPACKTAFWSKPTGETCPNCQALLVFAAKSKVRCSSKECKFEK